MIVERCEANWSYDCVFIYQVWTRLFFQTNQMLLSLLFHPGRFEWLVSSNNYFRVCSVHSSPCIPGPSPDKFTRPQGHMLDSHYLVIPLVYLYISVIEMKSENGLSVWNKAPRPLMVSQPMKMESLVLVHVSAGHRLILNKTWAQLEWTLRLVYHLFLYKQLLDPPPCIQSLNSDFGVPLGRPRDDGQKHWGSSGGSDSPRPELIYVLMCMYIGTINS